MTIWLPLCRYIKKKYQVDVIYLMKPLNGSLLVLYLVDRKPENRIRFTVYPTATGRVFS